MSGMRNALPAPHISYSKKNTEISLRELPTREIAAQLHYSCVSKKKGSTLRLILMEKADKNDTNSRGLHPWKKGYIHW